MAAKQRSIAVSEFFLKNRHLLGFDSPHRALLTAVKEAVDNSRRPAEIKPHPHGVELGQLIAMLRDTRYRTLSRFLRAEFSRIGPKTAREIIGRSSAGLTERSRPTRIAHGQAASLHRAIAHTKIRAPSVDCIVPIGEAQLLEGLRKQAPTYRCVDLADAASYKGPDRRNGQLLPLFGGHARGD